MNIKLIVFDMDNTLIEGESIDEVARLVNKEKEVAKITRDAMRGKANYSESLKERARLLEGISREKIMEIANNLKLKKGATRLIRNLRARGIKIIMITGSFDLIAERIGERLGIDKVISNKLLINNDTVKVTGPLTDDESKAKVLAEIMRDEGTDKNHCVVVGEGMNDVCMFKIARSITFNSSPIKDYADITVNSLDEIINKINVWQ